MFRLVLRHTPLAGCVLTAFVSGLGAQVAAQSASLPDFSPSSNVGWVSSKTLGFGFIPPKVAQAPSWTIPPTL
jgi:hypothetical protein